MTELTPENRALIERCPVDQECFLNTRDVATAGLNILLDAARKEGRDQVVGRDSVVNGEAFYIIDGRRYGPG